MCVIRILRSITIKKASSRRSLMSLCYKTISSCCSCAYVEILSTWEVWRALKRLELHSAAPRATLTPLSCSPNFPRAQYLDIRTLMNELIVNFTPFLRRIYVISCAYFLRVFCCSHPYCNVVVCLLQFTRGTVFKLVLLLMLQISGYPMLKSAS